MGGVIDKLVALPLEVEISGTRYKLAPLGLGQIREIEQWARRAPFEELDAKLAAVKDKAARNLLTPKLVEQAMAASENPASIAVYMDSVECMERQFRLSLQTHHPGLTEENMATLAAAIGPRQLQQIVDQLVEMGSPPGNPQKGPAGQTLNPTGPTSSANLPTSTGSSPGK